MNLKDSIKLAKQDKIVKRELASTKWTKAKIQQLLETNNEFVERALCVLLSRQTTDEVRADCTSGTNNMGFTSADAKLLTSFAKQIRQNEKSYPVGRRLSIKQFHWARKKIMKYATQLAKYANNKEMVRAGQALGINNHNDFVKGGTFRKVDYGHEGIIGAKGNTPTEG